MPPDAHHPTLSRRLVHLALILLVCIAVYWIRLGDRPFAASEGHRVIPGWTMLETGDWLQVRMFGLTYIRKPPGIAWAIAATSSLLGHTEFGARAASATCATLAAFIAYLFALRWFPGGRGRYALGAGLAQALTPLFWSPGRTAEIESLNNLGTQLACLGLIGLLIQNTPSPREGAGGRATASTDSAAPPAHPSRLSTFHFPLSTFSAALGILIAALAKGPASAPCLLAAIAAPCLALRSARPLLRPGLWLALALAAAALIPLGLAIARANDNPAAVRESVSHFLWSGDRILGIAGLLPVALVSALPTSLALLFPFGREAREEAAADPDWHRCLTIARALVARVIAAVLYMLAGVGNARYVMPASAAFLPPLVAYILRGRAGSPPPFGARGFTDRRKALARALLLRNDATWAVVLAVASILGTITLASIPLKNDSRTAGRAIAGALPSRAVIWADAVIEARPDVLLYADQAADRQDKQIEILWAKHRFEARELPLNSSTDLFLFLREDVRGDETAIYRDAITAGLLVRDLSVDVSDYRFTLFRVRPRTSSQ